jgi:hypothetical protein
MKLAERFEKELLCVVKEYKYYTEAAIDAFNRRRALVTRLY